MLNPERAHGHIEPRGLGIRGDAPPMDVPAGYVGPAWLPGTGRMIWWTGRVAIGLRHSAPRRVETGAGSVSADWVQSLML